MAKDDLTAQQLRDALDYNPETGLFHWRTRQRGSNIGMSAGCSNAAGYTVIRIAGELYFAHRLAWLYSHCEWPVLIDHKNGARSDNRLANLRLGTARSNGENQRKGYGRTGLLGVTARRGKWRAQITVDGRNVYLGTYITPEAAHEAYLAAKRKFHEGCTI